jgi:hypothetical protein
MQLSSPQTQGMGHDLVTGIHVTNNNMFMACGIVTTTEDKPRQATPAPAEAQKITPLKVGQNL